MNIISNFQFPISNQYKKIYSKICGIGNWKLEIGNSLAEGGFTLIELIIVIGILGIFATGIIATINPYDQYKKAQDAKRKSELSQIQKAVEAYYQDNGSYPVSSVNHKIQTLNSSGIQVEVPWGGAWQPYMNVLPKDPGGRSYSYFAPGAGQSYYIYASLERGTKDPNVCSTLNSNGECSSVDGQNLCGNNPCNYGVSSPNVIP